MTIEDAIIFAAEKHRGQHDKAGEPYILHPLRVAMRLTDERDRLVAILHDVVEDAGVTRDELREHGLDGDLIDAVMILSKRDGEPYCDFYRAGAAQRARAQGQACGHRRQHGSRPAGTAVAGNSGHVEREI